MLLLVLITVSQRMERELISSLRIVVNWWWWVFRYGVIQKEIHDKEEQQEGRQKKMTEIGCPLVNPFLSGTDSIFRVQTEMLGSHQAPVNYHRISNRLPICKYVITKIWGYLIQSPQTSCYLNEKFPYTIVRQKRVNCYF